MNDRIDVEQAVMERYSQAAQSIEPQLCCPIEYDPRYLEVLPEEIKERDYGCGDPSTYVREGDAVLDLGSGGGKICYIAAQIVGPTGRVIGVDANDEMLALAEKYRGAVGNRIGYHNVTFRKGRIQDLRLDLATADAYLAHNPVRNTSDWGHFDAFCQQERNERPMIDDESVDVVLSNCVLNLVRPEDKTALFSELFRVVKRGGRVAICDIVSDEDVPAELQRDPALWSGCVSGALREDQFMEAFDQAGFYGMEITKRDEAPWQTVEGIEFRSITVMAYKGKQGPCWEHNQAVIYKGPWRKVIDDDGHVLERGKRMAVCEKTFQIYQRAPYGEDIVPIAPYNEIGFEEATPFNCKGSAIRHARQTKGKEYNLTDTSEAGCCETEDPSC